MPHPRPVGPPDALSIMLRTSTSAIHEEAERQPFMQRFFAGELPRDAYVDWMGRQWHLYKTLESALEEIPSDAPEHGLVSTDLHRTARIEADLDHLTDGAWRDADTLTPATKAYADRIDSARSHPAGVVAHAWLRYMGNVGGRDVLRRIVSSSIGASEGDDRGLSFTDFSAVGDIRPFFTDFHGRLDALPLSTDEKDQAVAEADAGFRLNIALTDELASDHNIEHTGRGTERSDG